jgi:hypothetical protein
MTMSRDGKLAAASSSGYTSISVRTEQEARRVTYVDAQPNHELPHRSGSSWKSDKDTTIRSRSYEDRSERGDKSSTARRHESSLGTSVGHLFQMLASYTLKKRKEPGSMGYRTVYWKMLM